MSRIKYNERISYEIYDNGYAIYDDRKKDDVPWIEQYDPYAKLFKYDGTYEENCILHIKDLVLDPVIPPTETEKIRADLDFLALMNDVILPSQEGA